VRFVWLDVSPAISLGRRREAGPSRIDDHAGMHPRAAPGSAPLHLLVGSAMLVAACGGGPPPRTTPSPVVPGPATPSFVVPAPPTAGASDRPSVRPQPTDVAFGDAWDAVVESFDTRMAEVMISNPLSEYDLVGTRLIDLIDQTRLQLSTLAPPASLREDALALDTAIGATLAMLEAIDPHGDRRSQAEAFQHALDDWVDRVLPLAQAIRDSLALPPVPPGDLQL
jgi:hypothetical protein